MSGTGIDMRYLLSVDNACFKVHFMKYPALMIVWFLRNCLSCRSILTWYPNLKMLVYHLLAEMKPVGAWRLVVKA